MIVLQAAKFPMLSTHEAVFELAGRSHQESKTGLSCVASEENASREWPLLNLTESANRKPTF